MEQWRGWGAFNGEKVSTFPLYRTDTSDSTRYVPLSLYEPHMDISKYYWARRKFTKKNDINPFAWDLPDRIITFFYNV